ncbi:hypothetical protein RD055328_05680 [Companilactobacillus sp. RD055328]|uniref:hypothetical protein n=1 Tax=Companilactobacillus sp. RD055328 TaxID=2916634 RepID=UPI001FC7E301|nr:hypothetical protein [Companilactobacillus sp. RD055328]GKQ42645.1 hypothetical protein RD055328_05680 [Companilactobacillus sp. RD055328]
MKNKVMNIMKKPAFKLLILSIAWIIIIIPTLSSLRLLDKAVRVSWIFTIINPIFAALIGRYIKLRKLNFYITFIFPVVFIIEVIIRYGNYGFLFGIMYLLISWLSYILTSNNN